MLAMQGTLTIKTINGRNGEFNVGDLVTEEGEFKVKDPILDQYSAGKYTGQFMVSNIFQSSYISYGRVVAEIRLSLQDMALDNVDDLTDEDLAPQNEPDPIDEPEVKDITKPDSNDESVPVDIFTSESKNDVLTDDKKTPGENEVIQNNSSEDNPDAKLFGHIWPLSDVVKLDATIERSTHRQQCQRLKQDDLGYEFHIKTQHWCLVSDIERVMNEDGLNREDAKNKIVSEFIEKNNL